MFITVSTSHDTIWQKIIHDNVEKVCLYLTFSPSVAELFAPVCVLSSLCAVFRWWDIQEHPVLCQSQVCMWEPSPTTRYRKGFRGNNFWGEVYGGNYKPNSWRSNCVKVQGIISHITSETHCEFCVVWDGKVFSLSGIWLGTWLGKFWRCVRLAYSIAFSEVIKRIINSLKILI